MRSKICWLTVVFAFCVFSPDCQGQGLFQRLRDRIRGNAQATPNVLPARPIPSPTDGSGIGPTSNYRSRVVPIPSETDSDSPTDPRGVRQASAEQELDESRLESGFGKSILDRPTQTPGSQPSIGIQGLNANPGYPGVEVRRFDPISKADEAGLKTGDFIFAVDGIATPNTKVLVEQVSKYEPGDTIRLRIGRDGQVRDIDIPLVVRQTNPAASNAEAPRPTPRTSRQVVRQDIRQFGAEFKDVAGSRGTQVVAVEPGSAAEAAGLRVDDRIVAIDNRLVTDSQSLSDQLSTLQTETAELRVVRGKQLVQVEMNLGGAVASRPIETKSEVGTPTLAEPESETKTSGSMFGGLGSALGGVFGAAKPNAATAPEDDELALPEPIEESEEDENDAVRDEIAALKERLKELESKLEPK